MNTRLYGLMAEFEDPRDLVAAARRAYQEGYRKLDAYSPFPIEGLAEELGHHRSWLPLVVLIGGIAGAVGGFGMQYYLSVIEYPLNIGGRPLNSWPSFIPITFEVTVLLAALSAVVGMILMNGLPRPYHPVFNLPRFELASRNHFFLCIEATDSKFDRGTTRQFLQSLRPLEVSDVES